MKMTSTPAKNAGYLLTLAPQMLLVLGTYMGHPWLSVAFFFALLPVARQFIGNDLSAPNKEPSAALGLYLRSIPRVYVAIWALVLPWTVWTLATMPMTIAQYVGFSLALWIVCSLNTAVAHELIHSRSRVDRKLGSLMDASVGYFHFTEEHLSHHARNGFFHSGDAAAPGTSVYAFAFQRYGRSLLTAWEFEQGRLKRASQSWRSNRLLRKSLIPVLIATVFYAFAGPIGLGIYLFQLVGSAFTVQAITYLQHWGLSEAQTPSLADHGFSWDDGCWMQACVTLNHAYHSQHHLNMARPYYAQGFVKSGLLLPASYPVMFVVALVPSIFSSIMKTRLKLWIDANERRDSLEHDDDCIGASRIAQAMRDC